MYYPGAATALSLSACEPMLRAMEISHNYIVLRAYGIATADGRTVAKVTCVKTTNRERSLEFWEVMGIRVYAHTDLYSRTQILLTPRDFSCSLLPSCVHLCNRYDVWGKSHLSVHPHQDWSSGSRNRSFVVATTEDCIRFITNISALLTDLGSFEIKVKSLNCDSCLSVLRLKEGWDTLEPIPLDFTFYCVLLSLKKIVCWLDVRIKQLKPRYTSDNPILFNAHKTWKTFLAHHIL